MTTYNDQPQFDQPVTPTAPHPRRIPFPGLGSPVGLGTVISNLASSFGVVTQACGGCQKRKEKLDRRVEFVPPGWV